MKIKSVFPDGGHIPERYTCDGDDVNPPIEFSEVPKEAKSLALVAVDVDSPQKTWVHWILWNIPPQTKKIPENCDASSCTQGINDFGNMGYGGPCPRSGTHRYQFMAYALKAELNIPEGSTMRDVENAIDGNVIDSATLTGTYSLNSAGKFES